MNNRNTTTAEIDDIAWVRAHWKTLSFMASLAAMLGFAWMTPARRFELLEERMTRQAMRMDSLARRTDSTLADMNDNFELIILAQCVGMKEPIARARLSCVRRLGGEGQR